MALELLNGYVAVKDPVEVRGVMRGEVVMVAANVTDVQVGDKAFYDLGNVVTMDVRGEEYILIKANQLVAKR